MIMYCSNYLSSLPHTLILYGMIGTCVVELSEKNYSCQFELLLAEGQT